MPGTVELFKSDGTAGGTVQLTFGTRLSDFNHLTSFNGKLFFAASDTTLGYTALWTSDGTVAGTAPFLAVRRRRGLGYYDATSQAVAGNKLYFAGLRFVQPPI